ncbi:hypothetical protein KHU50_002945 [Colletotrichum sp. SAR 10_65]|nr:hypothetical protein KHU50_002945 [Colletotrichum sp. SAR 10_65]KAJ5000817.1 hypothetical protein K4K48_002138 [Colletotrichum sp. SAR 10_66]
MPSARYHLRSTLDTYPLGARPSPTLSRACVEDCVTVPTDNTQQKRKRKREDREINTVLDVFHLQRHEKNAVEAVYNNTKISSSQVSHGRRLDYLQAAWPQGEFIPLKYQDPVIKDVQSLSRHVINDLRDITKACQAAMLSLSSMWEDLEPNTIPSPRSLLVQDKANCGQAYFPVKITKLARLKVKHSGWPNAYPALPAPANLLKVSPAGSKRQTS